MGIRQHQFVGGDEISVIDRLALRLIAIGQADRFAQRRILAQMRVGRNLDMTAAQCQGQAFDFLGDPQDESY